MRLAYFYSRYPVLSQTFCDTEMLELERRGVSLFIASVHPPLTTMRHAHALRLKAPVHYAPPASILELWEEQAKADKIWPGALVDEHERKYGEAFKSALRARNAAYFAQLFMRERIQHFHVHFANRAAHTALFVKQMSGIPFSVTAHGQDFMSDLGSAELLQEICAAAEFVAAETDYSRDLLAERCPASAAKIHRVYNGMELENFPVTPPSAYSAEPPKILSIGRLVGFKGFEFLIEACAQLRARGNLFSCEIIGDGPLREKLQAQINAADLDANVRLSGALPQQDVFERLRQCDIFALASTVDAGASDVFPTVILEAMASGRPVISTQLAGIPEAVVHGTTGLLVEPGNSAALANAIARLIHDQWTRVEFGNTGRARV
ncbi:MAG: glycosyltransferase [Verrucomicrobiota bacterium]|nr:glycosyltransferase [Verrucomicrobiota bacterium]